MTMVTLRRKLDEWKSLLNLDHWQTTITWGTKATMGENLGLNIFSPEEEISEIYIRRKQTDELTEETLVHELLHLVFDGHKTPDGQPYSTLHERALNRTAKALVTLSNEKDCK